MTRCERCRKRSTCTELCPAAERYASCDYVSLRERYRGEDFFITQTSSAWERVQNAAYTPMTEYDFLTRKENELLQAIYYEGLTYAESARRFNLKVATVESIVVRVRKKIARDDSFN
jgi:DNA-directed RNA polymerase specialized sigma24 family protein